MNTDTMIHSRQGFSLVLVLFILFSFIAMYPLLYMQANEGLVRSRNLELYQRIDHAVQSSAELASATKLPAGNSMIATFTYDPGDFSPATYVVLVKVTSNLDKTASATPSLWYENGTAVSDFASSSLALNFLLPN